MLIFQTFGCFSQEFKCFTKHRSTLNLVRIGQRCWPLKDTSKVYKYEFEQIAFLSSGDLKINFKSELTLKCFHDVYTVTAQNALEVC